MSQLHFCVIYFFSVAYNELRLVVMRHLKKVSRALAQKFNRNTNVEFCVAKSNFNIWLICFNNIEYYFFYAQPRLDYLNTNQRFYL